MSETPGNGTDNKKEESVMRKKKRIGRISRFVAFLFVISLTGYGTAAAQTAAGVDSDPVFPFAFDLVLDEDTITYREEPAEIQQEELPPEGMPITALPQPELDLEELEYALVLTPESFAAAYEDCRLYIAAANSSAQAALLDQQISTEQPTSIEQADLHRTADFD